MRHYQLKLKTPIGIVALCCDEGGVIATDYLPATARELSPQTMLAREAARQIRDYFKHPRKHRFDLPLYLAASSHQQKVREVIAAIAVGDTKSYGDIAKQIHSCAQAVGNACRRNNLPLIIPCHRVVGKSGIGGFMGGRGVCQLAIKQFLLRQECKN